MPKTSEGLEQLLMEDLQDLFDAEKQLVRALPKMAKAASDEELENALREHLEVTKGQVQRLEQVFASMNARPRSRPCPGMRGLVEEGQQIIGEDMEGSMMDAAIITAGRKVEHYEMVGYESAMSLAKQLGQKQAAELLRETMDEEAQADKLLAGISKRLLKEVQASGRMASENTQEGEKGGSRSARSRGGNAKSSSRGASARSRGSNAGSNGRSSKAQGGRKGGSQRKAGGSGHPLTDHEEIRQWAEERGATPSCVRRTGGKGDVGMIRLDFPGYSGAESLQEISWDNWFEKFDESNLALIVQDTTSGGEQSNFNKLVKRDSVKDKTRTAR
jgi:ferritin-like metal-binding protein YciE